MRRLILLFIYLTILLSTVIAQVSYPPGFSATMIADQLDPTAMVIAPDGRIFITVKSGEIRIVENGILLDQPFLKIDVDNFNERGLNGIALDPEFDFNNYVYVYYTVPDENRNRVSRFTANGNLAIPGSELVLFELDELFASFHNAGALKFGLDGTLFIASGDGGNRNEAPYLQSTSGKILRINSDGTIPEDNPFYDTLPGIYKSIYAYGLRNPFTMDIHPHDGRIIIGDVGESSFEEINIIEAGKNYGWPSIEGYHTDQELPDNYQDPIYTYGRNAGCAITGVNFYVPKMLQFPPAYLDKIFFNDYCFNYIKTLDLETGEVETFAQGVRRPIAVTTSDDGSLLYIARGGNWDGSEEDNTSTDIGSVWQVNYTGSSAPFFTSQPQNIRAVVSENVRFSVSANGLAPLSYQWQKNGTDLPGENLPVLELEQVSLSDNNSVYRCIVSNAEGSITSNEAILTVVNNTRPVAQINSPLTNDMYEAGQTLHFDGFGTDAEDGELPDSMHTWRIDFHHNVHTHPALPPTSGIKNGIFEIPRIGELSDDVWYRVYLTVTDSDGFSSTDFVDVYPIKTIITINSDPAGIPLNIDGQMMQSPIEIISVAGITRTFVAPVEVDINDKTIPFYRWSDGTKTNRISYNAEQGNPTLTAEYKSPLQVQGFVAKEKYYDGNNLAEIEGAELIGVFEGDDVQLINDTIGYFEDEHAGENKSISIHFELTGIDAHKYYLMDAEPISGIIYPKVIEISPSDGQSKIYGAEDPEFTFTHTTLLNNDQLSGNLSRVDGEDAGEYEFTINELTTTPNYSLIITENPPKFTIYQAESSISWTNHFGILEDGYIDFVLPILSHTESTVSYAVDDTSLASIENSKIVLKKAGITSVTAKLEAINNYSESSVTSSLLILSRNQMEDNDGDGVPDFIELQDETDLHDANDFIDTDEGGTPDFIEMYANILYNLQEMDLNDPIDDNRDTDGDGVPDYTEIIQMSDPNDTNSFLDENENGIPDYLESIVMQTILMYASNSGSTNPPTIEDLALLGIENVTEDHYEYVLSSLANAPIESINSYEKVVQFIQDVLLKLTITDFALRQNYPNPFNLQTTIQFEVPVKSNISISVYDVLGQIAITLIQNSSYERGIHRISLNGQLLASGIYLVHLNALGEDGTRYQRTVPITLLK